mmetsp:Transcript_18605/g.40043  ORF Transcript_18605/g.40043 Transcript_18605/m.40043 type:complete len:472 (-) Transcript_18605:171-1586(-)|eukprot:CAMPEP_0206516160 /NCGR_PEP_ID=MMETSP0324_2-20121206/63227_1 /ASSEMBLY_ACC=CAM_ASM_000836 /TAXON_ID=2866 /ORGANISM="Crypthecodinium cohnii, Strain Seligo" /LENGTH=471 /DNA_ID=CAMNT_0054009091 /DNA_START=759 /DNA_END=2174 /DNA_ORIENTATION=+
MTSTTAKSTLPAVAQTCWLFLFVLMTSYFLSTVGVQASFLPQTEPSEKVETRRTLDDFDTKYVAHIMPWFELTSTITLSHWCNPSFGGSHYESVFGFYSSQDKRVIRKQLLLMQAAGIDGVWIDMQSINWLTAVQAIVGETVNLGMNFAIVIDNFGDPGVADDVADNLKVWMEMPNYYRVFGRPILPYYEHQSKWGTSLMPGWRTKDGHQPYVIGTYWVHKDELPALGYDSLFFWTSADLEWLKTYYENDDIPLKVGSVYRGWREAYLHQHHAGPYMGYLEDTLAMVKDYRPYFAQIVTWNDYTEGTMIEPSWIRDYETGNCGDPSQSFWQSKTKSCEQLAKDDDAADEVYSAGGTMPGCVAGNGEVRCSGSEELACSEVVDCRKPTGQLWGPPPEGCPETGENKTAFGDLAAIAEAILGLPFENSTAQFQAILDGWEPDIEEESGKAAAGAQICIGALLLSVAAATLLAL